MEATARLRPWQRGLLAVVAAGLVSLLVIAAWLRPNPLGMGTHQQLGLPPCTVVALYDMRCPSCGMTTSWSWLVRGRVIRSLQSNVGGTMLGMLAIAATPWLAISGFRGFWWPVRPKEWWLPVGSVVVVIVTLLDWWFRL